MEENFEFRNKNKQINENEMKNYIENSKLTLRKKKLNNLLLKKRLNNLEERLNKNNFLEIDPNSIKINNEEKFILTSIQSQKNKIIQFLTSQNLNYIKYSLFKILEFTINNEITKEEIFCAKEIKLYELLIMLLKFYKNSNIQILNTILWILINFTTNNDEININYSEIFIIEIKNETFSEFLFNVYENIVENVFWFCRNLSLLSENFAYEIFHSNFMKNVINICFQKQLDADLIFNILKFIINNINKFYLIEEFENSDYEKFKQISQIFFDKILFNNENLVNLCLIGFGELSQIQNKKISKIILNSGIVVRIIKKYTKFNKIYPQTHYKYSVNIISNLLGENENITKDLIDLNTIEFFEILFEKFENDFEIVEMIFIGFKNIVFSGKKFNDKIFNSILFKENIINKYLKSNNETIIITICEIIEFLLKEKEQNFLFFLYNKRIIIDILLIITEIKNQKITNFFLELTNIYLSNFSLENKNQNEFIFIKERFYDILNFNENIIKLTSSEKINFFINNIKNNYN